VARSRIVQLERKVGQQATEAEIFRKSLQRIEAARRAKAGAEQSVMM
jgi:hypothetical protein